DVGDLLREQPRIDGVQDRAQSRDAVIQFEMTVAVPGERRHAVAEPDAEPRERLGELLGADLRLAVVGAVDRPLNGARHDLGVAVVEGGVVDERGYQERALLDQAAHSVLPVLTRTAFSYSAGGPVAPSGRRLSLG